MRVALFANRSMSSEPLCSGVSKLRTCPGWACRESHNRHDSGEELAPGAPPRERIPCPEYQHPNELSAERKVEIP